MVNKIRLQVISHDGNSCTGLYKVSYKELQKAMPSCKGEPMIPCLSWWYLSNLFLKAPVNRDPTVFPLNVSS